jgi:hypothetical protein
MHLTQMAQRRPLVWPHLAQSFNLVPHLKQARP